MSISQNQLQKLGNILKSKREDLGLSLKHISEATKIRLDYLEALENGDYESLPADVYTKGFVRNYSLYVGINPKITLAFFRRENIKAKKDSAVKPTKKVKDKKIDFQLTPDKIILGIIGFFVVIFLGYIIFQVTSVVQKPTLELRDPIEISGGSTNTYTTQDETVTLRGNLEVGAELTLNDSQVDTNNLDIFEIPNINLQEGENIFNLTATNQFGIEENIILRVIKEPSEDEENPENIEDESEEDIENMSVEVNIGPREANILVTIDGEEETNWVEPSGTVRTYTANNSFSIQTPRPDSVKIAINGIEYEINSNDVYEFVLIDGNVVQTN